MAAPNATVAAAGAKGFKCAMSQFYYMSMLITIGTGTHLAHPLARLLLLVSLLLLSGRHSIWLHPDMRFINAI
jgi:hypothetical protein